MNDEQKAWLKASESGDMLATFNLGKYFADKENYEEAQKWFGILANKGHLGGLYKLGEVLLKVNKTDDAKIWLQKAAQMGHMKAKELLGTL